MIIFYRCPTPSVPASFSITSHSVTESGSPLMSVGWCITLITWMPFCSMSPTVVVCSSIASAGIVASTAIMIATTTATVVGWVPLLLWLVVNPCWGIVVPVVWVVVVTIRAWWVWRIELMKKGWR